MPKKPAVTKKAQAELKARVSYHLVAADGLVGMRTEKIRELKLLRDEILAVERDHRILRDDIEKQLGKLGDPAWVTDAEDDDDDDDIDHGEDDDE